MIPIKKTKFEKEKYSKRMTDVVNLPFDFFQMSTTAML
jgi:hypothetical protein